MKPEQVTAWALNELSAEERAQVEAAMAVSPEVRTQSQTVQVFCGLLASELTDEEASLDDERREALLARVSGKVVFFEESADAEPLPQKSRRINHMPSMQGMDGWKAGWLVRVAAIAACALLVGVIIFEAKQRRMERTVAVVPTAVVNSEYVKVTAAEPTKVGPISKSLEPVIAVASATVVAPKPMLSPPKPAEPSINKPMAALVTQVPRPETVKTTVERWGVAGYSFVDTTNGSALMVDLNMQRDGLAILESSLEQGRLPGADFRTADLVNSFAYDDPTPVSDELLKVTAAVVESPWAVGHRLVRVAIHARKSSNEVVARAVKLELAFNPAAVQSYRLLGYDSVKQGGAVAAAELRAGQTVVVLVEIVPIKANTSHELLADAPRYPDKSPKTLPSLTGVPRLKPLSGAKDELLTVRVPYQAAGSELVKTIELSVRDTPGSIDTADGDTRFAIAVTGLGMMLRGELHGVSWDLVRSLATQSPLNDASGERKALLPLIDRASILKP